MRMHRKMTVEIRMLVIPEIPYNKMTGRPADAVQRIRRCRILFVQ